jgi:tRNA (cytidine/uridine-2'-O-)-methyltransferase
MRLALYQPDIAQNVGTLIRLGACLGVCVDIIHPCGFAFSAKALKRSAMDYMDSADITEHADWATFNASRSGRLILIETDGAPTHTEFAFQPDDILMLGRESAGTPADVAACCDAVVRIPMRAGVRSLNVAIAGGIALSEALRQTHQFPIERTHL